MFVILSIFKDSPFVILAEPVIKTRSSNIRWDVFSGLENSPGRIKATLKAAHWVRDKFNLPISNFKFKFYFFIREYWFTLKEVIKGILTRLGLSGIIKLYRKTR